MMITGDIFSNVAGGRLFDKRRSRFTSDIVYDIICTANKAYVDEVVKLLALEEWYEKNR